MVADRDRVREVPAARLLLSDGEDVDAEPLQQVLRLLACAVTA